MPEFVLRLSPAAGYMVKAEFEALLEDAGGYANRPYMLPEIVKACREAEKTMKAAPDWTDE